MERRRHLRRGLAHRTTGPSSSKMDTASRRVHESYAAVVTGVLVTEGSRWMLPAAVSNTTGSSSWVSQMSSRVPWSDVSNHVEIVGPLQWSPPAYHTARNAALGSTSSPRAMR